MLGAAGVVAATKDDDAEDDGLSPVALVATTVHVYVLELVSDPTLNGDVAPVAVCVVPPSLDVQVAVNAVMALPPLPFAVNATLAELLPGVTPVRDGATGTVPASSDAEAFDAALSPIAFVAMTVHV